MIVLSLYDYTGEAVKPWANAGYECFCYDIQHTGETVDYPSGGRIHYVYADLHRLKTITDLYQEFRFKPVAFGMGFPVCTDLAVSGAGHFKRKRDKNPGFQDEAAEHAKRVGWLFEALGVPYFVENPVSVLATLWRKPNYSFQPYEYGGYISEFEANHPRYPDYIAPRDAYSKKTCLWTGNGFKMPVQSPVLCESFGNSTQHRKLGGKSIKTKNIRSATPRGFALAVFHANSKGVL